MIYKGTWQPADSSPFMPGCYARRAAGDGHVASQRYTGHTNWIWRRPHNNAIHLLAELWKTKLTPAEKALWLAESVPAWPARDYGASIIDKAFTAYANCNFAWAVGLGGTYQQSPSVDKAEIDTGFLNSAVAATSLLTWTLTYWNVPALELPAVTYLYQTEPRRIMSRRYMRYTRHVWTFNTWIPAQLVYVIQAGAAFGFKAGDLVTTVINHRPSSTFQGAFSASCTAT